MNEETKVESPSFFDSLTEFLVAVKEVLAETADKKGYARTKTREGGRQMYDFVSEYIASGSDAHALGEITYKAARFQALRNPLELVKIASWAFLVWDAHNRREAKQKDQA